MTFRLSRRAVGWRRTLGMDARELLLCTRIFVLFVVSFHPPSQQLRCFHFIHSLVALRCEQPCYTTDERSRKEQPR